MLHRQTLNGGRYSNAAKWAGQNSSYTSRVLRLQSAGAQACENCTRSVLVRMVLRCRRFKERDRSPNLRMLQRALLAQKGLQGIRISGFPADVD
ncbi:MAG TPA: hypothetical protein VH369_24390, partial [Bryobacteraceae bacterium]